MPAEAEHGWVEPIFTQPPRGRPHGSQPEVAQLDVALGVQEDVGRLDVAVHDALFGGDTGRKEGKVEGKVSGNGVGGGREWEVGYLAVDV